MRDFQRSAVYKSEKGFSYKVEFETLDQCKEYAALIVNSEYWISQKGRKRFKITDGSGCSHARACSKGVQGVADVVTLPRWSRMRWCIIHEFAHLLTDMTDKGTSGHGAVFCKHYLMLVKELLGQEHYDMLVSNFNENNVKYLRH